MDKRKINVFKIVFFALCAVFMITFIVIVLLHKKAPDSTWTLKQFSDDSGKQGTFYTLYNNTDGTLIVIDGGSADNARKVRNEIKKCGGVVDAWFITHFHDDHVSAFNEIYADPGDIDIRNVYCPGIELDEYLGFVKEWDDPEPYKVFARLTEGDDRIIHPERNEVIEINGLKAEIISIYDQLLYGVLDKDMDILNDISMVIKIEGEKDSILFLGDFHTDVLGNIMLDWNEGKLHAEYVQVGHHGNNSLPESFYEEISPEVALFDAPKWLMTGNEYSAKDLAAWFDDNGIKRYDFTTSPNTFAFE